MNENIDDWLNSLGIENTTPQASVAPRPVQEEHHQEVVELTESDIDDILQENDFSNIQEAEEVTNEEYSENIGEGIDLYDEETAVRGERMESGELTHVDQALRVLHEDIIAKAVSAEIARSVNEAIVPVSIGEESTDVPVVHEQTSEEALETESQCSQVLPENDENIIPENSPTLLIDDSTSRFSGAEWFNKIKEQSIIVAGCGGIGSWLAFQLARVHPNLIVLYDDDKVEVGNLSGQLFSSGDVGAYKVDALANMLRRYTTSPRIYSNRQRFTINTSAGDIMMCGFDNMAARKIYFDAWEVHVLLLPEEERKNCLFIDGRLSMDILQIFCITGDNSWARREYGTKYLFSDEEADETVCSLKQTTYLACMIGSLMTNLFVNFTANLLNPVIPYDLPFFTEYDAQNMIFKIQN